MTAAFGRAQRGIGLNRVAAIIRTGSEAMVKCRLESGIAAILDSNASEESYGIRFGVAVMPRALESHNSV